MVWEEAGELKGGPASGLELEGRPEGVWGQSCKKLQPRALFRSPDSGSEPHEVLLHLRGIWGVR